MTVEPNDPWRLSFASFLERLACGEERPGDWHDHVVTHYLDEELEEVRRELVRLSIQRDPTGSPLWVAADRQQFREWATRLRGPSSAEPDAAADRGC